MITDNIYKYNTITSLVQYEKNSDITYNKLFLKSKVNSNNNILIVNSTSFGNKYKDYIMQYVYPITLTDSDLIKYRYSPKLYCFDKYGTMEVWGLLLQINNMTSCTEFNKKTIKIFRDEIFDVINEILISEEDKIDKNNKDNDF